VRGGECGGEDDAKVRGTEWAQWTPASDLDGSGDGATQADGGEAMYDNDTMTQRETELLAQLATASEKITNLTGWIVDIRVGMDTLKQQTLEVVREERQAVWEEAICFVDHRSHDKELIQAMREQAQERDVTVTE
jgi:hypothetical protein